MRLVPALAVGTLDGVALLPLSEPQLRLETANPAKNRLQAVLLMARHLPILALASPVRHASARQGLPRSAAPLRGYGPSPTYWQGGRSSVRPCSAHGCRTR